MSQKLSFIFDIDGTLCPIREKDEKYEDIVPYENMVKKLREYKDAGAYIVLYTSRNMNTYNGNLGLINANTAKVIIRWLDKWGIPYDELLYGKPWPGHYGFYIDDRSIRPDEYLKYSIDELNQIVETSRKNIN